MIKNPTKSNKVLQQEIAELKQQLVKIIKENHDLTYINKFRRLFENSNDIVQCVDRNGNFLFVNKPWKDKLGYSEEEIEKINLFDIIHPDSIEHCKKEFAKILSGRKNKRLIAEFLTKSGNKINLAGNISLLKENNKVVSTFAFFRDITKQIKDEEKLILSYKLAQDSLAKLDEAQRIAKVGSWELDLITNTLTWSKEIYRLFDLKPKEFEATYEAFLDNIHPDDRDKINKAYAASLIDKKPYVVEHRLLLKDGTVLHVEEKCETTFNDKGNPVSSKGTIQNITTHVLAEEKLQEKSNELLLKANISNSINTYAIKLFSLFTIEDILWEIVETIIEKFKFEDCVIYLLDNEKELLIQKAAYGPKMGKNRKIINPITIKLGEGIVGSVGQTKKPEIINDTSKDNRYILDDSKRLSELAIPIIIDDKVIGVIDSEHNNKNYFTKEHLKTLTTISNLAASRIQFLKENQAKIEKEDQLTAIVESTPTPIILTNFDDGKIIFGNKSFSQLMQVSLNKLIGKSTKGFYVNSSARAELINELKEKGSVNNREIKIKIEDGSHIWIVTSMKLMQFNGKPTIFSGFTDISNLKKAEEKTKESEFKLNKFFNFAPIGIAINRMDGSFLKVNVEFSRLTGYSVEELNKLSYWDLTPKKYLEKEETQLKDITERNAYGPYEKEYISKNGTLVPVLLKGIIMKSESEGEDLIWSVVEDLTFQKNKEAEVISIAKELRQLIDTANAPIFGIDTEGNINEWNNTIEKITKYKKEEVIGKNLVSEYISKEYQISVNKVFDNAIKGEETSNFEFPICTKDKKRVMMLLNANPRKNIEGNITGVICVGQDISEIVSYREELESKIEERTEKLNIALKKEKELNELKSKFVSMTSHEFRTPLSTIKFAAGSMKKYWERLDPDSRNTKLDKIEKQVTHMTNLLDDILIIGKAETGNQKSNFELLNFNEFILPIIEEVQIFNESTHKITLLNKNTESTIFIDQKIARNLFINLLNNAIKFSPGKKEIIVEVNSKNKMIQIKVIDFGIGINKEDYEEVFQPFSRGKNVDSIQGNGLGLSIVKNAVELSGGEIKFESVVNKGTTFIINLKNDKQ